MSNSEQTTTAPTMELETMDVNSLSELQGWREKQIQIAKENPFVEASNHKTYEAAKKTRTNLVTARTTIEKQEKAIASKLRDFRQRVSIASKELIDITLPLEEKQQEEVRRYEAKKEEEKRERERLEAERKQAIKDNIDEVYDYFKLEISSTTLTLVEDLKSNMSEKLERESKAEMEGLEPHFNNMVKTLWEQLSLKENQLLDEERRRIEEEKLAKEREEIEAERRKAQAEHEAREKKAQEAKRREEERLKVEREKLEAERRQIEEEKARQRAIEEEAKRVKEEEERKLREKKKAEELERKREALRPDVEKLEKVIYKISTIEDPGFKNISASNFYKRIQDRLDELKGELFTELSELHY